MYISHAVQWLAMNSVHSLCSYPNRNVEISMKLFHEIVTIGFCQNAGRCNGSILSIAFDNAFVNDLAIRFETIAVY